MPSAGFVRALTRKYHNQRVEFIYVPKDEHMQLLLKEAGFNVDVPITVNAIFEWAWKRPVNWPKTEWMCGSEPPGPTSFFLEFRDCMFKQGSMTATPFCTRRYSKRFWFSFDVREVGGSKFAEWIRDQIPKLSFSREQEGLN
jgi:hypothetical protein